METNDPEYDWGDACPVCYINRKVGSEVSLGDEDLFESKNKSYEEGESVMAEYKEGKYYEATILEGYSYLSREGAFIVQWTNETCDTLGLYRSKWRGSDGNPCKTVSIMELEKCEEQLAEKNDNTVMKRMSDMEESISGTHSQSETETPEVETKTPEVVSKQEESISVSLDGYKEQLQELHNDEGWDCTFSLEYYDMFRSILQQAIQPTEEQIRDKTLVNELKKYCYIPGDSSEKCPRDNFNTKIVDVLTPRGQGDIYKKGYIYGLSLGNTLIDLVNYTKHHDTRYIATVSKRILEGLKTFQTGLKKSICDEEKFLEIKETGDDDEANTSTGKMRAQNFYLKVEDLKAILRNMLKTSYMIVNIKADIISHISDNERIEKWYQKKGETPHHIGVEFLERLQKIDKLEPKLKKLLKSQRRQSVEDSKWISDDVEDKSWYNKLIKLWQSVEDSKWISDDVVYKIWYNGLC
jgi:hypothetical protein